MDFLNSIYAYLGVTPQTGNTVFIVWLMTVLSVMSRTLPSMIYKFLARRITYTLTVDNAGSGWMQNEIRYNMLMRFILAQPSLRTKSLQPDCYWDNGDEIYQLGLGPGMHFFFYKRHLVLLHTSKLESSGTTKEKRQVQLTVFFGKKDLVEQLLNDATYIERDDALKVYCAEKGEFSFIDYLRPRSFDSIVLATETKNMILDDIVEFSKNQKFYEVNGIPYKRTIMLSGPPGTGKTSIVRALATHFRKPLAIVNASYIDYGQITNIFHEAPNNSIILIEDMHTSTVCKGTESVKADGADDGLEAALAKNTIGDLLNALDGAIPLHDKIIIMTTNDAECLDAALMRKGRVDRFINIAELKTEDVVSFIQKRYNITPSRQDIDELGMVKGCNLSSAYIDNTNDYEKFMKQLKEK